MYKSIYHHPKSAKFYKECTNAFFQYEKVKKGKNIRNIMLDLKIIITICIAIPILLYVYVQFTPEFFPLFLLCSYLFLLIGIVSSLVLLIPIRHLSRLKASKFSASFIMDDCSVSLIEKENIVSLLYSNITSIYVQEESICFVGNDNSRIMIFIPIYNLDNVLTELNFYNLYIPIHYKMSKHN